MANRSPIRFVLVACYFVLAAGAVDNEPLCLSRYDYDYKMLQKTFAIEKEHKELRRLVDKQSKPIQELNALTQLVDKQSETMHIQGQVITKMEKAFNVPLKYSSGVITRLEKSFYNASVTGSAYVRWGRTVCPGNGTETIYSGQIGGSFYHNEGGASNYLCLPEDPLWDRYDDDVGGGPSVYGAEYEIFRATSEKFFNKQLGDRDAPCAVCRSVRSNTVMIPGRNACYGDWTMEYAGYLATDHHTHKTAGEFVCLDKDAEVIPGSDTNRNGKLLYIADAKCGSLKCPPYVNGRELPCVVCTR